MSGKMEIDVFEGARGTGKSTVAFKMRQLQPETTLINFTGFHADGQDGLNQAKNYYSLWMKFLHTSSWLEAKYVFDRFYFSERVFSQLYKSYDFEETYELLTDGLEALSKLGVKINIFFLTINDKDELQKRLTRDKVPFGKAEESAEQSLTQQNMYKELFDSINESSRYNTSLNIFEIDTSGKTNDDVYEEVLKLKATIQ